jgi:SAM-dependent methyltransferase
MADDERRKRDEKAVYDREANLDRPIYSSYWDRELYARMFRAEYDGDVRRLARSHLPGKRVLVLGAGTAEVRLVSEHTPRVDALNISQRAVADLQSAFPDVNAFVADAETFRPAQPYQVVYCRSVLHHLQPFDRVVDNLAECLEPDGVLFAAAEPGAMNPFAAFARRFAPSQSHTPGERPFRFSAFSRALGRRFEPLFENHYFLASMLMPFAARKFEPAKPLLGPLLDLTLQVERRLRALPKARDLYWITCGVYRRR